MAVENALSRSKFGFDVRIVLCSIVPLLSHNQLMQLKGSRSVLKTSRGAEADIPRVSLEGDT